MVGNPDFLHPAALLDLDDLINAEMLIRTGGKSGVNMIVVDEHFLHFREKTFHKSVINIIATVLRQSCVIMAECEMRLQAKWEPRCYLRGNQAVTLAG